MKERPILFSAPMVRAIIEGRKTQTMRALKPQPANIAIFPKNWGATMRRSKSMDMYGDDGLTWGNVPMADGTWGNVRCPYGQVGDRMSIHMPSSSSQIRIEITGLRVERLQDISERDAISEGVERTVIGDAWRRYCDDAEQEAAGLTPCETASASFCSLWESINGPESWAANPWVWVVEFKKV